MKVQIRMLSRSAGPEGVFQPGALRTMEKAEADQLIKAGFASLVKVIKADPEPKAAKQPEKPKAATEAETAEASAGEDAMMAPPPRRRRKKADETVQEVQEDI